MRIYHRVVFTYPRTEKRETAIVFWDLVSQGKQVTVFVSVFDHERLA